jgi:hypothetical protein
MYETLKQSPEVTEASDGIRAVALRAEAWAGEPFLRADEDPDSALAPGTAMRRALDSALAELEAGREEPSPEWRVRFGLMLGLERILSEKPPHLASGTELRRHQIDALAGMLTELIAANEKPARTGGPTARDRRGAARRGRRDEDDLQVELGEENGGEEDEAAAPTVTSGRRAALPFATRRRREDDRGRRIRRGRAPRAC